MLKKAALFAFTAVTLISVSCYAHEESQDNAIIQQECLASSEDDNQDNTIACKECLASGTEAPCPHKH